MSDFAVALAQRSRQLDSWLDSYLTHAMLYQPRFVITPILLSQVEEVAALWERIQGAAVELSWIPALQKDTRTRTAHASTAIATP